MNFTLNMKTRRNYVPVNINNSPLLVLVSIGLTQTPKYLGSLLTTLGLTPFFTLRGIKVLQDPSREDRAGKGPPLRSSTLQKVKQQVPSTRERNNDFKVITLLVSSPKKEEEKQKIIKVNMVSQTFILYTTKTQYIPMKYCSDETL